MSCSLSLEKSKNIYREREFQKVMSELYLRVGQFDQARFDGLGQAVGGLERATTSGGPPEAPSFFEPGDWVGRDIVVSKYHAPGFPVMVRTTHHGTRPDPRLPVIRAVVLHLGAVAYDMMGEQVPIV
jgi:hypothetical protein